MKFYAALDFHAHASVTTTLKSFERKKAIFCPGQSGQETCNGSELIENLNVSPRQALVSSNRKWHTTGMACFAKARKELHIRSMILFVKRKRKIRCSLTGNANGDFFLYDFDDIFQRGSSRLHT
jgi:hypothetical protein